MDGPRFGERLLVPDWSYKLVALSFAISWIGAYTSTQIVINGKYARTEAARWLWTFLASVAFGFTAIWSMHFVGMLACGLDVRITFDLTLTMLSAIIAVSFTFAAFSTGYASEIIENSRPVLLLSKLAQKIRMVFRSAFCGPTSLDDPELGYTPIPSGSDAGEGRGATIASTSDREDDDLDSDGEEEERQSWVTGELAQERFGHSGYPTDSTLSPANSYAGPNIPTVSDLPRRPSVIHTSTNHRPHLESSEYNSEDTPLSTDSSDLSILGRRMSTSSQIWDGVSMSGTTLESTSHSWSGTLHAGLSRETRIRIKAQARDRPVPHFGWKYWMKAYYSSISLTVFLRAAVWALALVSMHYCGMWAMEIPLGRISWNLLIVTLSYIVALIVCFVGCIAMVHMEVHFGRQVLFSTISATGVCSMHYTGMAAATIYTMAPPTLDAGYPAYLPYTILGMAVLVCVVSNAVLAHNAIISRNHMAEVILTKRRFWRIMAEKEAAEQANELKQQFISVASHEIRTPLHAVNGYCELLAMTDLTEEQVLYVKSIQQACHAINVIAGNVLDFSKLDRDNVELSARPVLVDLRKMVEDQARIIETKGASFIENNCPTVDVIVSVADNVPSAMYLDETYTYRILMNLLSNAQKFCEDGYIYVSVLMESESQVAIKITDTGCGIPKSFRSALFQPFRQADSSMTRPKQGTGLGLSIVKHLAQRMSGTVDVESIEGEGSTFTVRLPITVPTSSPPTPTLRPAGKKRIKVVHRNERTARLLVDLWNHRGMLATLSHGDTSLAELVKNTDAIWVDVESLQQSNALKSLLSDSVADLPSIPVFVLYSDAPLDDLVARARRVILVKRPVLMHELVDIMMEPEAHMGTHIRTAPQRVRFALPSEKHSATGSPASMLGSRIEESKIPESNVPSSESSYITTQDLQTQSGGDTIQDQTPLPRETVLLVEDNAVNQHLGKRLLEKLGYAVVTANNGMEAIDAVRNASFYCCFMDCQMPVLDGFVATAKIRELENNGTIRGRLPIIALTANVSTENEDKCRTSGMDMFLPKPFKFGDLKSTLTQLAHLPER